MRSAARGRRRGDRGTALVELALLLPFVTLIVFGIVDYGRLAALQNRLSNSSREGAATAQFRPTNVDTGCDGTRNIVDQAIGEDTDLADANGYTVTVYKKNTSTGVLTAYSGCQSPGSVTLSPGDRVVVKIQATFSTFTPFIGAIHGSSFTVGRSTEVVVQG